MPKQDKTGPAGAGPRTGRGLGVCGEGSSALRGAGMGRRYGCGFGMGKFGGRYPAQPKLTKQDETEMLEADLKEIKGRLDELKK
ncbi:MAG: DUF5320 domain-containing protein [Patescibacteria group bacterium]|nr:DUF5320 domain-containing protein [Patescibacteria group bacterium]